MTPRQITKRSDPTEIDDPVLKKLAWLLKAEHLRIITAEHACGAGQSATDPGFDQIKYDAYYPPRSDPRHFVIHRVVTLEGPNHRGQYTAYSPEGDYCIGKPDALLVRLTEAAEGFS
jgi:hypothetical protein